MITNPQPLHALRRELEEHLKAFPSRAEDLRAMKRWERYPIMWYRTDLHVHGKRIASSLISARDSIAEMFPNFDMERAILLALVHDDAELVMGDFQSSNRALMSKEELAELDSKEERAIEVIAKQYPRDVRGVEYRALLHDVLETGTLEAQVVKYFDKYEGYAEAMHEIYAGNTTFFDRPGTEYGTPPNPFEYYGELFPKMGAKYPLMAPLIEPGRPFFDPDFTNDWARAARGGKPHTTESLRTPTGYQPYDSWIAGLLVSEDPEIIESLTIVKGSLLQ